MEQPLNPYETPVATVSDTGGETQPVNLFSVSGRIGRARYIAYTIGLTLLLGFCAGIAGAALGGAGLALSGVMWIAIAVLLIMLTIQRCHDFDTSGWLSLLAMIPLVSLIFWFIPGTQGPNRFGPPTPPNNGWVIAGVCVIPAIFVIGIMAAVALPAYQDYTYRARVTEGLVALSLWKMAVAEHYATTGKLPASESELPKSELRSSASSAHGKVSLGPNGVLTLTMSPPGSLAGKTVLLEPYAADGTLRWKCTGGTLEPRFRPGECRG